MELKNPKNHQKVAERLECEKVLHWKKLHLFHKLAAIIKMALVDNILPILRKITAEWSDSDYSDHSEVYPMDL